MANWTEMQARCDAATDGPWVVYPPDEHWRHHPWKFALNIGQPDNGSWIASTSRGFSGRSYGLADDDSSATDNAAFIAHARTDLPLVLATIAQLREAYAAVVASEDALWSTHASDDSTLYAELVEKSDRAHERMLQLLNGDELP